MPRRREADVAQRHGIGDGPERRSSAGSWSAERGGRGLERRADVYAVLGANISLSHRRTKTLTFPPIKLCVVVLEDFSPSTQVLERPSTMFPPNIQHVLALMPSPSQVGK